MEDPPPPCGGCGRGLGGGYHRGGLSNREPGSYIYIYIYIYTSIYIYIIYILYVPASILLKEKRAVRCAQKNGTTHLIANVVDHEDASGISVGVVAPVFVEMVHGQQAGLPIVGNEQSVLEHACSIRKEGDVQQISHNISMLPFILSYTSPFLGSWFYYPIHQHLQLLSTASVLKQLRPSWPKVLPRRFNTSGASSAATVRREKRKRLSGNLTGDLTIQ